MSKPAGTLHLPARDDADRATREKVILALIPVAARHSLFENGAGGVVEIATALCQYIASGKKHQDTPKS